MTKLKICYFPGRESSYSRTRVILKGMKDAGVEVLDCSYPERKFFRYIAGFWKFLLYKGKSDIVFIGFFGHFIMPVVKLFTGKKIIFDAFVSVYQTMVFDRKVFRPGTFPARLARLIDRVSCRLADAVILDTDQHIEYFVREYNLKRDRFYRIPASADDSVMFPRPGTDDGDFTVHFHGEFHPLHGVGYILEAAAMLPDVKFQIVGRRKDLLLCLKKGERLESKNVTFIPPVSYERLAGYMAGASVCLGIFGNTRKAGLVIPNKVYEALAMGKPVITADTQAARELLTDGENALLCGRADPKSLAEAIKKLKDDKHLRERIAENGQRIFKEKCSPLVIGRKISAIAERISRDITCGYSIRSF